MNNPPLLKQNVYLNRQKKLSGLLPPSSIAVLPSAEVPTRTRDLKYPFCQNSDFRYFCDLHEDSCILVFLKTSSSFSSILYLKDRDPAQEVWEGKRLGIKRARKILPYDEVKNFSEFFTDITKLLSGQKTLYFPPGINRLLDEALRKILDTSIAPNNLKPCEIVDMRTLTANLRFIKDRHEISLMQKAVDITVQAFDRLFKERSSLVNEKHTAALLEADFYAFGAESTAFDTIVATGHNTCCLHHMPTLRSSRRNELMLVDAGASFAGYSADITRVIPTRKGYNNYQSEVYDIVYSALQKAISKVRPGCTLAGIHQAGCKEITRGLLEIGILRGQLNDLLKRQKYKPYFMHGTSHFLGLDTHDISPIYFNKKNIQIKAQDIPLVAGNVITVEPGLYFGESAPGVPRELRGLGIRLEEDVLVTSQGHKVMSKNLPVQREELANIYFNS